VVGGDAVDAAGGGVSLMNATSTPSADVPLMVPQKMRAIAAEMVVERQELPDG
jgi:hypothetical protein